MPPDNRYLSLWASGTGLFLWCPAWAMPGLPIPLQPLDLWVIAGWPAALLGIAGLGSAAGWILLSFLVSVGLSSAIGGAEPLVLGHALVLALGFVLTLAVMARSPAAREALVTAFLWGAGLSALLFLAQFLFGAQSLDFRTNLAFSLPEQYGRGFALMPEVSTFATHSGIALAMIIGRVLAGGGRAGPALVGLALLLLIVLMLSRSTSFLVVTPLLCLAAVMMTRGLDLAALMRLSLALAMLAVLLGIFFSQFYADRLESASATRSAAMRLASVLGGLSPLWSGEVFGVGIGDNQEITRRAFDIGRALGLSFGQLPRGVNSQIIARVFEEGWPAVLHFGIAATVLLRAMRRSDRTPASIALCLLALGSCLGALVVTGYRGIYTNWIWLGLPAGLLLPQQGRRPAGSEPASPHYDAKGLA